METTPAPETPTPGAFPQTNGTTTNGTGKHDEEESGPAPPPHKTAASPVAETPVSAEEKAAEAEAYKAAGNKFYKAKQYEKAIQEYSKGKPR